MTQQEQERHGDGAERPALTLTCLEIAVFACLVAAHLLTNPSGSEEAGRHSAGNASTPAGVHATTPDERNAEGPRLTI